MIVDSKIFNIFIIITISFYYNIILLIIVIHDQDNSFNLNHRVSFVSHYPILINQIIKKYRLNHKNTIILNLTIINIKIYLQTQ